MKKNDGKRVLLSPSNVNLVTDAIKSLRDKQCKVNSSDFTNEVLEIFFKKYMILNQRKLETKFFDRREYLKNVLNSDSEKDFDESLKKLLRKISTQPKNQELSL